MEDKTFFTNKIFMDQQELNKKKGFISLITVIILVFTTVIVVSSVLLISTDSFNNNEILFKQFQSRQFADTCVEYAIENLKNDQNYIGNETITFSNGNCQILTITGVGNINRTIQAIGNFEDAFTRIEVNLVEVIPLTDINYWRYVQQF